MHATLEDLARAKGVNATYVSRVLRLTLLAPEIVEAILDGRQPAELQLDDLLEGFPLEWGEQQRGFSWMISRGALPTRLALHRANEAHFVEHCQRAEAWRALPHSGADIGLLQEAAPRRLTFPRRSRSTQVPGKQTASAAGGVGAPPLSVIGSSVVVDWIETAPLAEAGSNQLGVSRRGTLAAAHVTEKRSGDTYLVVSLYGLWEKPHAAIGGSFIYADASVHRLISDLSALVGQRGGRRIIAAGDLNILLGYGEYGNQYWATRYATVFDRLAAIGLTMVGPQAPRGRQADPWPSELPTHSRNVPTYFTTRQSPETATRQLDFVFASADLADRITVTALNEPACWGPSDHCRLEIVVL